MIKNICYFVLFMLLIFIAISPFTLIYIKVNEGDNLYYLFLVMIIFFLPSLIDFLYNREDMIFSFSNLLIGSLGLIVTGIIFLMSYFEGDLSSATFISPMIVVPLELVFKHLSDKDRT